MLLGTAVPASAHGSSRHERRGGNDRAFEAVASFDVMAGNGSVVAEIVDVSGDGRQLVYTDGEKGEIGFVDIADPADPQPGGVVVVGGEPTSLVVRGRHVIVAVDDSAGDFVNPSGRLVVVDRKSRAIVRTFDLGAQPDSVALSPNKRYGAVVIENQRDEDLNGGLLPQGPTGGLLIVDFKGDPQRWTLRDADLGPVAAGAADGDDLEAEYVDINRKNLAVVTFQENNHLAVVDLRTGETVSEFSAGAVDLHDVDTVEDDLITFDSDITKRREPDGVAWIDEDSFASANEGDYEDANGEQGGSRGFTVFNIDGTVEHESAESFEHWLAAAGHYNEGRSENKGVEPESAEVGTYRGTTYLFIGSERANVVGVYDVDNGAPTPVQLLPTGIGPEGLKAIPSRGLFVASTETDVADSGIPTMINIYAYTRGAGNYPMIASAADADGNPIPWVALSGMAGDRTEPDTIYAVSDSFLADGFVYTIDLSASPALIVDRTRINGASASLDLEGIAVGPDGSWWLGSEGNADSRPNLVLKVDPATGAVLAEIALPAGLVDQRRSNGIEGIAVTGTPGNETVYVAIQRAWPDEGDTDQAETKIGRYDIATGTWGFVHYPLQPETGGDWIGLSELTLLPDGTFAVIERDKGWGPSTGFNAELKALYGINLAAAEFRAFDDPNGLATIDKTLLRDVLPDLVANSIWTAEKLEGVAVAADGEVYVVTDNDGIDDATGETVFLSLGNWHTALSG
ncbi:MAG: esterase-like activity of phytase family protein [Acidimicrobiales bacterium]